MLAFRFLGLAGTCLADGREIEVLPPEPNVGSGQRRRRQAQREPLTSRQYLAFGLVLPHLALASLKRSSPGRT